MFYFPVTGSGNSLEFIVDCFSMQSESEPEPEYVLKPLDVSAVVIYTGGSYGRPLDGSGEGVGVDFYY